MLDLKSSLRDGASPAVEADPDPGLSFSDLFRMVGAHKWFILACTLGCLAAAAIYVHYKTPVYEAMATLRIDPGRAGALGLSDLTVTPPGDPSDGIHTEIAILKSDGVAIRTLDSLTDDQFHRYTGLTKATSALPQDSTPFSVTQENLIGRFKLQTGVKQEETTQLIDVSFRDKDPVIAAVVVNQLIAAYTLQSFSSRDQSVAQLRTWLSAQMATLKAQVETSQEKLAAFQQANNIIGTADASNITTDRLKLLNDALTGSTQIRIAKESQMRAAMTGNAEALASLFPNPKLQSLQSDQGTLYARYAQLSTKFGTNYPPLAELRKQMQAVDAEIASDVQSVRNQLQQEYSAALTNQNMLQGEYDNQAKRAYAFNRNQAEYAVLQAEVTSSRELYDTLQRKLQQAGVDAQINGVDTTLIDRARTPLYPIEPKKSLILVSAALLGLFAGIAAAFLAEATSDKLQNLEQVERVTGFRVLAAIPRSVGGPRDSRRLGVEPDTALSLVTIGSPLSRHAEAYRTLRNALLSYRSEPLRTLLFVSALPAEGLARVTVNLAVSLAQTGSRVLLVDADLRQPSLHTMFALDNGVGLGDYLRKHDGEEKLVQPLKAESNLCLMTAGAILPFPADSLASEKFRSLVQRWTETFDYVVLKSAPLLIVTDALPLTEFADATVLVSSYQATLKELQSVRKMLGHTHARVAGVLIDGVPATSDVHGGYGDYGKGYYADSRS